VPRLHSSTSHHAPAGLVRRCAIGEPVMSTLVNEDGEAPKSKLDWWTKCAALIISVIYICAALFLIWLFGLGLYPFTDAGILSVVNWERGLAIFNNFSAIGYAAVGVLLGTKVQEVKVAMAEKKAEKEKKEGDKIGGQAEVLVKLVDEYITKKAGSNYSTESLNIMPDRVERQLHEAITEMTTLLEQRKRRRKYRARAAALAFVAGDRSRFRTQPQPLAACR
jgi:hypothetical protein